ncbi:unnamed protein product (macronuclear) [Paramecium tetraurelia]|uniref:Transmembrane protein n=1 Tax=Paramecium tetraurelia TaxID=5888 RepID=A0C5X7_PARTE|nr:uncharacterized protein GSPATT00035323001 [Paramecium tetraurelia]CAK66194.1 unnamed protein product [Paramecium tetraurelia]|eukprot:XP_001433591.1 hypothetical protein (macronuclear) [Paramecium tetraurelia strain d4-2]
MQNAIINSLIIAKKFIIKQEQGYVPRPAILELQYQMVRKDFSQTVVLELQYQQYQINESLFLLSKKCNIINIGIERKFFQHHINQSGILIRQQLQRSASPVQNTTSEQFLIAKWYLLLIFILLIFRNTYLIRAIHKSLRD